MTLTSSLRFAVPSRTRPQYRYGVLLRIVPGNQQALIEIERAPDSAGSPGTFAQVALVGPFPRSGGFFFDELPNTGATWWYRARHAAEPLYGTAGSYTTDVENAAAFSATAELFYDADLHAQAGATAMFTTHEDLDVDAVQGDNIADSVVDTEHIADLAVEAAKIAAAAVEEAKIAAGAVTTSKLGALAVTAEKIGAAAVETAKIANLAVTEALLAAAAVTTTKIGDDAITTAKIAAGQVTAAKIAAATITANEIAANTITAAKIAANTITAAEIAAGAIATDELAANAVTAAKIAALTITAAEIAAGTITGAKIAALTIEAANIAANTITAAKIAAGTITATEIASNAITADKINAGAVTAAKISVTSLAAIQAELGAVTVNSAGGGSIEFQNSGDEAALLETFTTSGGPTPSFAYQGLLIRAYKTATPATFKELRWYYREHSTLGDNGQLYAEGDAEFTGDLSIGGNVGFYGTAAHAKPTITGSRGGNAALADLLTSLESLGLISDGSSI